MTYGSCCDADCQKIYNVSTEQSGTGTEYYENGTTETCEAGDGACPGALCSTLDCPDGYTRRDDTALRCTGLTCSLDQDTDTCCIQDFDCQITWNADSCNTDCQRDITAYNEYRSNWWW